MSPTRRASSTAIATFSFSANGIRALNTAMDMALVGPLINCLDESNRAPTAVIIMAVYSPYSTGMPAMAAYAMA